jgi:hypothetical protein
MSVLAGVVALLGVVAILQAIVGLVAPRLFADKKTGKVPKRGELFFGGILLSIILFGVSVWLAPDITSHSGGGSGGDSCVRDGDCNSGECKHFQCTGRIKPKGYVGDRCIFDGDCKSDECEKFRCVVNANKEGYN